MRARKLIWRSSVPRQVAASHAAGEEHERFMLNPALASASAVAQPCVWLVLRPLICGSMAYTPPPSVPVSLQLEPVCFPTSHLMLPCCCVHSLWRSALRVRGLPCDRSSLGLNLRTHSCKHPIQTLPADLDLSASDPVKPEMH